MCLIGVKETYVQKKKKVTKNLLGQICTTISGLKLVVQVQCLLYVHTGSRTIRDREPWRAKLTFEHTS